MIELVIVGARLWIIWGVLLGVTRVNNDMLAPDIRDGDLVFYDKILAPDLEDLVVWSDGGVGRWNGEGDILGRAVLLWRARGI